MDRQILHIAIPSFPIALARVTEARLRRRPVAVASLNSERALLQCVSEEARSEGIEPGTPVFRARRLCPSLAVIPPDPILLAKGNAALTKFSVEFTPLVETQGGRVYLDLTASRRLFGPARDVAARLERSISKDLRVEAVAGSGGNKLVSRIAADTLSEPGIYDVLYGSEKHFLAPFPVSVLPGVGESRQLLLFRDLNLQRVEQIAELSIPQLRLAVGPFAPLLHERANGIDRSPVQPPRKSTEIEEEAFLEREENDDEVLTSELLRLVEACGIRLRHLGKETRKITLTVTYTDGVTDEGKRTLPHPLSLDIPLFAQAQELLLSTCRRRVRVRGLRLSCGNIGKENAQMELFSTTACDTSPGHMALQTTLDHLRDKFGHEAVTWGRRLIKQERELVAESEPPAWDSERTRYMTLTKRNG
ncbi:DNA polymerase IV [Geobacter sp. DSM 9736]|uniref:DNA polymerase Y family protein n=1 Tax=Geobacter sp. DSM 9736 TaxID=1277350 RepID=UPI000B503D43|nr:DNA polymerase IV [Geobacter sp. DSM 9736]SNB45879.1 DNA polymerase-4 [Geobacter sp. DSM 9736]